LLPDFSIFSINSFSAENRVFSLHLLVANQNGGSSSSFDCWREKIYFLTKYLEE